MEPLEARLMSAIRDYCRRHFPKFEVEFKTNSKFHQFLGSVMFWMNRQGPDKDGDGEPDKVNAYLQDYISVIGYTVAFPDMASYYNNARAWRVLAHEVVHMHDRKRLPLMLFDIGYVMPQIFAVLSLGAIGAFWNLQFLWFLVSLVCLFLPSWTRAKAEFRGYAMTMACEHWVDGKISDSTIDWIVTKFVGSHYLYMWPFKSHVRSKLEEYRDRIESGDILSDKVFEHMHAIVQSELRR